MLLFHEIVGQYGCSVPRRCLLYSYHLDETEKTEAQCYSECYMTKVSLSSSAVSAQQRTPIYVANLEVVKSKKNNNKHLQINQGISYQIDPTNYTPPPPL